MKQFLTIAILSFIVGFIGINFVTKADATFDIPKTYICHYDGQSGNYQTLHITIAVAIGHLAHHESDYSGICKELTPTPTIDPCISSELVLAKGDCVTPSPEVTETPIATPEATVTIDPVVPPAGHGDGLSDGKSDGRSSCPECTKAPVVPSGPPATGRAS